MEKVTIGKITNTVGLRGEVKVFVITDFPNKRFKKGQLVTLYDEDNSDSFETKILTARKATDRYVLSLANIDNIDEAAKYIGYSLLVTKEKEDLPKGFFFHDDLVGCQVFDESQTLIGIVKKVEDYPAHRTLRIGREDGNDVLVPFIKFFIKDVNIEQRTIVFKIIDGML